MTRTPAEWAREHFQPWPCDTYADAQYAAWFLLCHANRVAGRPIPKGDPWWRIAYRELADMIWQAAVEANNARLEQEAQGAVVYTLWTCMSEDGEERGWNVEPAGSTGWIPPGPHWSCVGTVPTQAAAKRWCADKS